MLDETRDLIDTLKIPDVGLGVHDVGGEVIAVAGLTGGVGTSTLAYTVAVAAALQSTAPVLVADLGGPLAAIAALSLVPRSEQRSAASLAFNISTGQGLTGRPFGQDRFGVRVLAAIPEVDAPPVTQEQLLELLEHLRAESGLVVVDCATASSEAEWAVLRAATRRIWVAGTSETAHACARARIEAFNLARLGSSALVAMSDEKTAKRRSKAVGELAGELGTRGLLWPSIERATALSIVNVVAESADMLTRLAALLAANGRRRRGRQARHSAPLGLPVRAGD
jgi:MinD-like ATPase involved in chromosome partitioning or flagellar assembly